MTVTFPLSLPSGVVPASAAFGGTSVVAQTQSRFTGEQQTQVHQGQWWKMSLSFPPFARGAPAEELTAFLISLNGREGTFLFGDPAGATPRGTASSAPGAPVVDGASQTGSTLAIKDATAGAATYLLAGDYIQLGSNGTTRLHKVLNTVVVDSAGDATIDIWPSLRTSPSDGATVIVADTQGLWRLAGNASGWDLTPPILYSFQLDAIEAL